jgi:hypothetical protein
MHISLIFCVFFVVSGDFSKFLFFYNTDLDKKKPNIFSFLKKRLNKLKKNKKKSV